MIRREQAVQTAVVAGAGTLLGILAALYIHKHEVGASLNDSVIQGCAPHVGVVAVKQVGQVPQDCAALKPALASSSMTFDIPARHDLAATVHSYNADVQQVDHVLEVVSVVVGSLGGAAIGFVSGRSKGWEISDYPVSDLV